MRVPDSLPPFSSFRFSSPSLPLSLFHVVVDTDETAATILEHMNREKAGRVTFIPLSQIQEKRTDMPISETATPMLNELEFKPMFRKAFQLVRMLHASFVYLASLSHISGVWQDSHLP